MAIRAGVLTVSDKGSRGERVDTAGPAVASMLREAGFDGHLLKPTSLEKLFALVAALDPTGERRAGL